MTGGAGEDVFIYSAGKDVVKNYSADDTIKISSGKISKTAYKGDDVIFSVGSGSITVKDGNGKQISITDAKGVTTSEIYSNSANSRDYNLLEDNNFVTDEFQLDDITEEKIDVTEIQTNNAETFAQDENILTHSENK